MGLAEGGVEVAELAVDGDRPAVGGDGFAVVAQHGGGAAEADPALQIVRLLRQALAQACHHGGHVR
jgi:hypothetical protein